VLGSYVDSQPAQAVGLALTLDGRLRVGTNRNVGDADPINDFGAVALRDQGGAVVAQFLLDAPLRPLRQGGASGPVWVAASDDEVLVGSINGDALASRWPFAVGSPVRAAIACGNDVAVLAGSQVSVFSALGALSSQFTVVAAAVNDLACDASRIYLTGYRQASPSLQVTFAEAYSRQGALLWRSWGWSASAVQGQGPALGSDTRGTALRLNDDRLVFAGSSAAGASIFSRDPQNLLLSGSAVSFDAHNATFNVGGPSIGHYADLNPETGALRRGQFLLTRLNSGSGSSVSIQSLAIDGAGRLHAGGRAFAFMANRTTLQADGQPVGAYSGGDPHLLVVPADFSRRDHWTTFVDSGARGSMLAVAARGDRYALLIESDQGSLLTPRGAIAAGDLGFVPSASQPAAWLGLWGVTGINVDRIFADGFECGIRASSQSRPGLCSTAVGSGR